ncbi:DUF2637 domain-containing protein [Candidatus Protofrankia californiensis]|uniref:DUF2637 domain-containing protein n=1 Tax=Candidatus Protofrankia californiensis TaxID=1839754 RepID=UPI003D32F7A8
MQATTIVAVVAVAAVAAFVSYRHMRGVALEQGEDRIAATVIPFSVDGLIVAASMTMLRDRRAGRPRSWLSYTLLTLGACASLAANVMHAEATLAARIIAGWPPLALLGSYELLMRQIHTSHRTTGGRQAGGVAITVPAQRGEQPAASSAVSALPAAPAAGSVPPGPTGPVSSDTVSSDPVDSDPANGPIDSGPAGTIGTVDNDTTDTVDNGVHTDTRTDIKALEDGVRPNEAGPISEVSASLPATLTPLDAAGKRDAIVRALEQTGGAATEAVALLAAQGVKVSRSWVYQVRKDTHHGDVDTAAPVLVSVTKSG